MTDQQPDPDRVDEFVLRNDLVDTMHRRGLLVARPLADQVAANPQRALRKLARAVAGELRASGYAIPIPPEQRTIRDRYASTPLHVVFLAVLAAALVIAAIALAVWSLT